MRLYIAQHGEARPKAEDPDRPLSPKGRGDVETLGDVLAARAVRPARIYHSGKTRARESAEIIAAALDCRDRVGSSSGVAPDDSPGAFVAGLGDVDEDLMLVGHQPYAGRLVAALVVGDPERPLCAFRPGAMVCLAREEGGAWRIAWMHRPVGED